MNSDNKNINPNFKKKSKQDFSAADLLVQIKSGNKKSLSLALSLAESSRPEDRNTLNEILQGYTKASSKRIAITGPPGAGKSTLINSWGSYLADRGSKLAVLSIDPSSPESGGSILGDKTRMDILSVHENAFVRPTASGNEAGGVAASTMESILLCELAGYDYIIIETVGVGQSELTVAEMVDLYILVVQPGAGDDLQGIKRGIMELADLFVVNKADGDQLTLAKQSAKDLLASRSLIHTKEHGRKSQVQLYSSVTSEHITSLDNEVNAFFSELKSSNYLDKNREKQMIRWLEKQVDKAILEATRNRNDIEKVRSEMIRNFVEEGQLPIMAQKKIKEVMDKII